MSKNLPDMSRIALEHISLRRMPSQQRSRERVERMLNCAAGLIADQGSDAMKMSEVARLADISIGSLYQYFPDKSAIIRALAEHYGAECLKCIEDGLAGVTSLDALCEAMGTLTDVYYALFLAEPVIRDIRFGTQADKSLQDLEITESRESGALLSDALLRVAPNADDSSVRAACFLIMYLGEQTMRLAISVPPDEGAVLVTAYKRMAEAELRQAASSRN